MQEAIEHAIETKEEGGIQKECLNQSSGGAGKQTLGHKLRELMVL